MSRPLGAFDTDDDFDRPDLNKCPDCGCFFEQDNCPLCGNPCPPHMRAGNRKPEKKKRSRTSRYRHVTFVEWYHSWWFILLMMFFFPLIGIILFATSPYKRSTKIIVIIIAVLYGLLSSIGILLSNRFWGSGDDPLVNTSLSESEYVATCEAVSAEDFYRNPEAYKERYVTFTLTITKVIKISPSYAGSHTIYEASSTSYYLCQSDTNDAFPILIRDCSVGEKQNYVVGDRITVYGEGAGNRSVYEDATDSNITSPCIYAAYIRRESSPTSTI